jgi:hypothetical protein
MIAPIVGTPVDDEPPAQSEELRQGKNDSLRTTVPFGIYNFGFGFALFSADSL